MMETAAFATLLGNASALTLNRANVAASSARTAMAGKVLSVRFFFELALMTKRRCSTTDLSRAVRAAAADPRMLAAAFTLSPAEVGAAVSSTQGDSRVDWDSVQRSHTIMMTSPLVEHELWGPLGDGVASALRRAEDEIDLSPAARARIFTVALEVCLVLRQCEMTAASGRFLWLIGQVAMTLTPAAAEVRLKG